jgi:hypothetical protein
MFFFPLWVIIAGVIIVGTLTVVAIAVLLGSRGDKGQ